MRLLYGQQQGFLISRRAWIERLPNEGCECNLSEVTISLSASAHRRCQASHLRPRRVQRLQPDCGPTFCRLAQGHRTAPRELWHGRPPKSLIETTAEALLDAYLIVADGWLKSAQPREIVQVKDKNNKLAWPERHDYLKGKRRFKSDLRPATILIVQYFAAERDAIATLEQQLDEIREENSGGDRLFDEVIEGKGDKVDDTWMARLQAAVQGELDRV